MENFESNEVSQPPASRLLRGVALFSPDFSSKITEPKGKPMAKPKTTIDKKVKTIVEEVMSHTNGNEYIVGRKEITTLVLMGFNSGMEHAVEIMN